MISGIFVKLLRVDMAVRIGWDEYEVALLIDACNKIRDNKIDKTECVQQLSNLLRQRAKANGINIDEVFRNENGVALQMTKMEYLLTDGKKGLPGASKLYIEMAKMSKLNSDEFEKILMLAKEQIADTEAVNNMNTREKFIRWLPSNPINKYSSNTIVNTRDNADEVVLLDNTIELPINENSKFECDFNNLSSLTFTKPIKATYFNETVSESTSWQKLFMDLLKALYEDYADTFKGLWGVVYSGSKAPLIGRKDDLHLFRKPGELVHVR